MYLGLPLADYIRSKSKKTEARVKHARRINHLIWTGPVGTIAIFQILLLAEDHFPSTYLSSQEKKNILPIEKKGM